MCAIQKQIKLSFCILDKNTSQSMENIPSISVFCKKIRCNYIGNKLQDDILEKCTHYYLK